MNHCKRSATCRCTASRIIFTAFMDSSNVLKSQRWPILGYLFNNDICCKISYIQASYKSSIRKYFHGVLRLQEKSLLFSMHHYESSTLYLLNKSHELNQRLIYVVKYIGLRTPSSFVGSMALLWDFF